MLLILFLQMNDFPLLIGANIALHTVQKGIQILRLYPIENFQISVAKEFIPLQMFFLFLFPTVYGGKGDFPPLQGFSFLPAKPRKVLISYPLMRPFFLAVRAGTTLSMIFLGAAALMLMGVEPMSEKSSA